ncbi:MAG: DUF3160 domain-containing protein [Deltaproteobacteria bacterium]|nr:DUF3160 domain-containing protein [Deltaproteobacteria bacterium]
MKPTLSRTLPLFALVAALSSAQCNRARSHRTFGPPLPGLSVRTVSGARYEPPPGALTREQIRTQFQSDHRLTHDEINAHHPVQFAQTPRADLANVPGLDVVTAGPFAPNAAERERLQSHGFVLAPRLRQSNFLQGYTQIFLRDQPVYFSADAITNALHESFDTLITSVEKDALHPALTSALTQIRTQLSQAQGAALSEETRADLDTYLAITLSALTGQTQPIVANGDNASVTSLTARINAGAGTATVQLLGVDRTVDFSQMQPRGHYTQDPTLQRYFRAVMWLGREGFRLVDVENAQRVLRRRQVSAALAMRALSSEETRAAINTLEQAITSFAGEPEALGMRDLDTLSARVAQAGGLSALSDPQLLTLLDDIRGVRPRVATSMLVHPDDFVGTVPQPVYWSLTPQRYTPDSRVLSMVSYDRVDGGRVPRMIPSPLDAAFGALGNDYALRLLAPDLQRFGYATELETARVLIDAHEQGYWQGSMYASWMAALRTLSPRQSLAHTSTLPVVMQSESWAKRLLNTQLAAWAEVRHDTVLYTAQSYSTIPGCSYPQAYVEPYPELWQALNHWISRAQTLITQTPFRTLTERTRWTHWAEHSARVLQRLQAIAEHEREGLEMTADELAWMNQAVNAREQNVVCTSILVVDGGWYYDLFEPRRELGEQRDIVSDVHTTPADEHGNPVGNVLHIGTASPQAMVVLAGPAGHERAYVGFASSYREHVTTGFARLTDERWRTMSNAQPRPAWIEDISGPMR